MNKLFRPKCLRRVLLCLALLFPIVYLCGSLFFTLAGSHGEIMLAEDSSISNLIYDETNTIKGVIPSSETLGTTFSFNSANGYTSTPFVSVDSGDYVFTPSASNTYTRLYIYDKDKILINYLSNYGNTSSSISYSSNVPFSFVLTKYDWNGNINVDSSSLTYSINAINYTDFLFSQPFESNNFITSLGKDLINGSNKGFAPMNDLFRTINSNIMHFESTDGLAMFGFGYIYYAVNVLIIYEILILAVKLIMLPLKTVDLFDKKEDI